MEWKMIKFFKITLFLLIGVLFIADLLAAELIRYNGSSTILKAIMYDTVKEFKKQEGIGFDLKGKSTGYGIKKLLGGECDIAGGGRPLKSEEKSKGLVETKAFLDAYAFIVHKSNPVDQITSEQITALLSGKLTNWSDLGGPAGKKIMVVAPPKESAHFKNAKKIVGFSKLPKNFINAKMTPDVYTKVKSFPISIGWLSYANVLGKKDVKILKIVHKGKPVEINQVNLVKGDYPYQQAMYFYTLGQPLGKTGKFLNFMKDKKGRTIIVNAGFFLPQ